MDKELKDIFFKWSNLNSLWEHDLKIVLKSVKGRTIVFRTHTDSDPDSFCYESTHISGYSTSCYLDVNANWIFFPIKDRSVFCYANIDEFYDYNRCAPPSYSCIASTMHKIYLDGYLDDKEYKIIKDYNMAKINLKLSSNDDDFKKDFSNTKKDVEDTFKKLISNEIVEFLDSNVIDWLWENKGDNMNSVCCFYLDDLDNLKFFSSPLRRGYF